jgi:hypothetical protein
MDDDENDGPMAANSEIRFIALELMKLAQKSGKSFEQMADEYMENTCLLQELIQGNNGGSKARARKGSLSRQK